MKKYLLTLGLGFMFALAPLWSAQAGLLDELRKIQGTANDINQTVSGVTGTLNSVRGSFFQIGNLIDTKNSTVSEGVALLKRFGINLGPTTNIPAVCQADFEKLLQCSGGDKISGAVNCPNEAKRAMFCYQKEISGSQVMGNNKFNQQFNQGIGSGFGNTEVFDLPECGVFSFCRYSDISIRQFILNVINFILSFLGILAVAMVIYAGYLYVMSFGDDGNAEKAKKIILYAAIGILVILASYAIVNTILTQAGLGGDDRNSTATGFSTGSINSSGSSEILNRNTSNLNGGGTLTSNQLGSSGGNGSNIAAALSNPIAISGTSVQDAPASTISDLASAKDGLIFKMNVIGIGVFDFGDGTQGVLDTSQDPEASLIHVYGEDGTYNVRLIVETTTAESGAFSKQLTIGGVTADFTVSPNKPRVGEKVRLDASRSRINKGTIRDYNFSCSGAAGCFADVSEKESTVVFTEPGAYEVTLTATASVGGLIDTSTQDVVVLAEKPEAEFSYRSANDASQPGRYILDAAASKNISGDLAGLEYNWSIDGDLQRVTGPELTHTFEATGDKVVELLVVQNINGERILSEKVIQTISVESVIPADFDILQTGSELLEGAGFDITQ